MWRIILYYRNFIGESQQRGAFPDGIPCLTLELIVVYFYVPYLWV